MEYINFLKIDTLKVSKMPYEVSFIFTPAFDIGSGPEKSRLITLTPSMYNILFSITSPYYLESFSFDQFIYLTITVPTEAQAKYMISKANYFDQGKKTWGKETKLNIEDITIFGFPSNIKFIPLLENYYITSWT